MFSPIASVLATLAATAGAGPATPVTCEPGSREYSHQFVSCDGPHAAAWTYLQVLLLTVPKN
jgi:hypothetical protein